LSDDSAPIVISAGAGDAPKGAMGGSLQSGPGAARDGVAAQVSLTSG